jgi:hypothetical protein
MGEEEESSPRLLLQEDFVVDEESSSLPKPLVDRVGDELQFCQPHLPGKFTKAQADARMHVTMALAQRKRNNKRHNTTLLTTTTTTTTTSEKEVGNNSRLERALALQNKQKTKQ